MWSAYRRWGDRHRVLVWIPAGLAGLVAMVIVRYAAAWLLGIDESLTSVLVSAAMVMAFTMGAFWWIERGRIRALPPPPDCSGDLGRGAARDG